MTDPNYRAMWEKLLTYVRDRYATEVVDASAEYMEGWRDACDGIEGRMLHLADQRTPDPNYTPAVRRVAAWVGNDEEWPRTDITDAYMDAAHQLLVRAQVRRGCSWERIEKWWPEWRIQRLASLLRHRDEREGHR